MLQNRHYFSVARPRMVCRRLLRESGSELPGMIAVTPWVFTSVVIFSVIAGFRSFFLAADDYERNRASFNFRCVVTNEFISFIIPV